MSPDPNEQKQSESQDSLTYYESSMSQALEDSVRDPSPTQEEDRK